MSENQVLVENNLTLLEALQNMPVVTVEEVVRFRNAALSVAKEADKLRLDVWVAETTLEAVKRINHKQLADADAIVGKLQFYLDAANNRVAKIKVGMNTE